jgi:glutaredoxin
MEVIVYTRPDCENSRRIKEILSDRGVDFKEQCYAEGAEPNNLGTLNVDTTTMPVTVIDGVPIAGLQRAEIEQAIGWIGF